MNATSIGASITGALTSGLTMITSLATGLKDAILHIFTDGTIVEGVYTPSGISVPGIIMLVFGGVALAFGLSKLAFHLFERKVG